MMWALARRAGSCVKHIRDVSCVQAGSFAGFTGFAGFEAFKHEMVCKIDDVVEMRSCVCRQGNRRLFGTMQSNTVEVLRERFEYQAVRASDVVAMNNIIMRETGSSSDTNCVLHGREAFETGLFCDWTGNFGLTHMNAALSSDDAYNGLAVAFPKSTQEVSLILSYCNRHRIPVVPQVCLNEDLSK